MFACRSKSLVISLFALALCAVQFDASRRHSWACDEKPDKDKEQLQGIWPLVAFEVDGQEAPEDLVKDLKLTVVIAGDKITEKVGDTDQSREFSYKLDSTQRPCRIEMTITGGDGGQFFPGGTDKGTSLIGIYSLEGDDLVICYNANGGEEAPKEFKTKNESGLFLYRVKRAKDPGNGAAREPKQDNQPTGDSKSANTPKLPVDNVGTKPSAPSLPAVATTELSGRVLKPDGKPAGGARVFVLSLYPSAFGVGSTQTTAAADGTFQLSVARSELALHLAAGREVQVVATADDAGMVWRSVGPFLPDARKQADKSASVLQLVKDDVPLNGRIETTDGQPLAGVKVELIQIWSNDKNDLSSWLKAIANNQDFGTSRRHLTQSLTGPGGVSMKSTTTDDKGRFRLTGLGAQRLAVLRISGPSNAVAMILARTAVGPQLNISGLSNFFAPQPQGCFGAEFTLVASPARSVKGVIQDADTGANVPDALVRVTKFAGSEMMVMDASTVTTNAEGRFKLEGLPLGNNKIIVQASTKEPYLPLVADVDTSEGSGDLWVTLKVRRGLWAEGQVLDSDTGRPLTADVAYFCVNSNPNLANFPGFAWNFSNLYQTDKDGRFRVPVMPGLGAVAATLHGQNSFSKLFGNSTKQAGKAFPFYGKSIEGLGGSALSESTYATSPSVLFAGSFHQIAVIEPTEKVKSVTADMKVSTKPTTKDKGGRP
jgi:uncharacterized protein (TIGR03067 family)